MNRIVVAVFLVALTIAGTAWAGDRRADRDKMQERIEILTMWKVMNALDLDKQTSEKILQIRSDFLKRRKELSSSLRGDFHQLKQLLKESRNAQNESQLSEVLKSIRDKRRELSGLWDKQYEAVSKVLPVRKQAELVLLLKDLHMEMRSLVLKSLLHRFEEHGSSRHNGSSPAATTGKGPTSGDLHAIFPGDAN